MKSQKNDVVVGSFSDSESARRAIDDLVRAGFDKDDIGMAGPNVEPGIRNIDDDDAAETKAGKGAAVGAATGAGVGALWALGIVAGFLPAIGPVIAGGTLAAIAASAATGAAAAGLVGAMVGLGIPEEEAEHYERELQAGRTVVTVKAKGNYDNALSIINRYQSRPIGAEGEMEGMDQQFDETGEQEIHLSEEQVEITKERVSAGEVIVSKEVVTEYRTAEIPVQHDELVIERRAAEPGDPAVISKLQPGEEIRIPLSEEQVHVEKEVVPTETVRVGKRVVQGTQPVTEELRKEKLRVEKEGEVRVRDPRNEPSEKRAQH